MDLKRLTCRLAGHRWNHHRMPDHTVKSTCRRCGLVEFGRGEPDWRANHIVGGGGPSGPG
ncbi:MULTISPECIES: DUF1660 family phage protein [unclassified Knoellia]|uniref:DUF1660 family phage protein n=1 Tax=Knoellia altitudinis TaxID=3404795 RepID=UPI0036128294